MRGVLFQPQGIMPDRRQPGVGLERGRSRLPAAPLRAGYTGGAAATLPSPALQPRGTVGVLDFDIKPSLC
jgi:hypothetical protein